MIRLLSLAFVAVAFLVSYESAFAHADLASTNPPVNGTVVTAPTEVSITFHRGCGTEVLWHPGTGRRGKAGDEGAAHTAPDNDKLLSIGLKPLTAGTYKVIWHAMAADDAHKTKGNYTFTVKP